MCLITFLALLIPSLSLAEEPAKHLIQFGGLNNFYDSYFIDDADSPDALNVLTDEGDLRSIYGNTALFSCGSSAVTFLGDFIDSTGRHIGICKSSNTVYAENSSGVMTAIQTLATDADIDMATAFQKAYFVDGANTSWTYDGTSTATATNMPVCKYVEFGIDRLFCALSSTQTSTVWASGYNAPTVWTTGTVDTDPAIKYFSKDDGEMITGMKFTPFGLIVGKETSIHFWKGTGNNSFWQKPISTGIGVADDRTMQMVDGEFVWVAKSRDGIFAWDGATVPRWISKEITPTVKQIRKGNSSSQSWNVSTQADWQSGNYNVRDWTTVIPSSSVKLNLYYSSTTENAVSYSNLYDDGFQVGEDSSTWTVPFSTDVPLNNAGVGGSLGIIQTGDIILECIKASDSSLVSSTSWSAATTWTLTLKDAGLPAGSGDIKMRITAGGIEHLSNAYTRSKGCRIWTQHSFPINFSNLQFDEWRNFAALSGESSSFNTNISSPILSATIVASNTVVNLYASDNGSSWGSATAIVSGAVPESHNKRYYKYTVQFSTGAEVPISSFTSLTITNTSTAPYNSPVQNVGANISAWGLWQITDSASEAGMIKYYSRSSATIFAKDAVAPSWTLQTNNSNVSVSTNAFYQWRIEPQSHVTSTMAYSATIGLVSWITGEQSPRMASVVADHRYHLSYSSSSSTQNDAGLIWQKNKKWVPAGGPIYGAMALYKNNPIAGDGGTSGKIWNIMDSNSHTFDNSPIESRWTSKDFIFDKLNNHKTITRFWISAQNNTLATTLGIAYQKDRDGTWVSTDLDLSSATYINRQVDNLIDGYAVGRQFRFRFTNSTLGEWFRIKAYSIYYNIMELIQ